MQNLYTVFQNISLQFSDFLMFSDCLFIKALYSCDEDFKISITIVNPLKV